MRIARQCRQYAHYHQTPQQRHEHRAYLKRIALPPLTNTATNATSRPMNEPNITKGPK